MEQGSERPLRILHVFRAPLGGLFRHVLDVARGQIERGHAVGIFCDSSTGGARADDTLGELAGQLALGVHRLPMRRMPHPRDLLALAALTSLHRRLRPDVLHGHGSKGGAFARLVSVPGQDRSTIRAYTPHGGSFNYRPGSVVHYAYMKAEALLDRRTDVFLFESDYVRSRFAQCVGQTTKLVRVVHNGIADAEFEPLTRVPDPFDLVYIGELRAAKGVETLIDAVALIRREHGLRLTTLVVGGGPSEAELHIRTQQAGIWDSTAFVPPQPIRQALSRGRIMVVPSLAESLPYVILEAAAAQQPLVSTNVGGIGEIFGPYADELIPPGDPGRLAQAILSKVREQDEVRLAKTVALSGHVRSRFCIDRMVTEGLGGYRAARAARGIAHERHLSAIPLSLP
ncbi:glycosyltransferase family 4 protein [Enterovirga sp.]|uniref:glycosyltransferase family 4 protein n=1 Tax=Enterovirga sp. TaxID=2026350 RepID=UPI002632E29D|nr:glycosyltransferase family 4 protein [Enterovirga sp.]MDB5592261.1 glycosyltransferase family 1 protein [Enterovirga sp.]